MRWALAWTLYAAGHIFWLWYHNFMHWSERVQGPSDRGPWNERVFSDSRLDKASMNYSNSK
jgi:hypothetical protein